MHQLIYISQATRPLSDADLTELLQESRQRNAADGITGVLLYGNERFVQVVEGEVAALADLYGRLLRDARHHTVTRLAYGPIPERRFMQWSMAFRTAARAQMEELAGYANPDQLVLCHTGEDTPDGPLFQLIQSFAHDTTSEL
ncbi:BLUF domain-containing protein [Hymenobacter sp. BT664]|uniref:BLUF domain-containing protein n=1 Tax=Hymenobacter montanus TaxID=2771359 RepID=A0A927GHM5_9BACT|nr:BLUF domain-containing protein [Hymenobacter montanus]MBD2766482.1 BLUF domain-containing protein [Hymenobacter montanus]